MTASGMTRRLAVACTFAGMGLAVSGAAYGQTTTSPPPADPPQQLVTALHVHSTASSGSQTLQQLVALAESAGVDALVLAENLGYEFRYAPQLLRPFFEARASTPTLERYGVDRYLAEIEDAVRATPAVMLLPGVEVPPYYYWTGSLFSGDLTLNDMQRNVLVLPQIAGSHASSTAGEFLRNLPAVGNRHHREYGPGSLALVLPGLLLGALAFYRLRREQLSARRPGPWCRLAALVAGIVLLWFNFPFSVPSLTPYDSEAGHGPVQRLFDYVRERDGLVFWSMPEAVDYRERGVGPVSVQLTTQPYPEAIADTDGYTGFGGVYADTVTIWEPGQQWDTALREFQARARTTPPWLVGESAYHYPGHAGKRLDDVLTILLVEQRTPEAAFAALADGHGYSLRREEGSADLRLLDFALVAGDSSDTDRPLGRMGDTLELPAAGSGSFEVFIRVADNTGSDAAVEVDVVRNGELYRRFGGATPLRERWSDTLAAGEDAAYYRVIVRGAPPAYLVSNPIFVRRGAATGGNVDPAGSR